MIINLTQDNPISEDIIIDKTQENIKEFIIDSSSVFGAAEVGINRKNNLNWTPIFDYDRLTEIRFIQPGGGYNLVFFSRQGKLQFQVYNADVSTNIIIEVF